MNEDDLIKNIYSNDEIVKRDKSKHKTELGEDQSSPVTKQYSNYNIKKEINQEKIIKNALKEDNENDNVEQKLYKNSTSNNAKNINKKEIDIDVVYKKLEHVMIQANALKKDNSLVRKKVILLENKNLHHARRIQQQGNDLDKLKNYVKILESKIKELDERTKKPGGRPRKIK